MITRSPPGHLSKTSPNLVEDVKSKMVPATGFISPVGIWLSLIGVNCGADMVIKCSFKPSTPESCPARLKYPWLVKLSGVGLVTMALISILTHCFTSGDFPSCLSPYTTLYITSPGYPSSPSLLRWLNVTSPLSWLTECFQTTLSSPTRPPWWALGPQFKASLYSTPSRVNLPFAILFATLPTTAPIYGLSPLKYFSKLSKPRATSILCSPTLIQLIAAP